MDERGKLRNCYGDVLPASHQRELIDPRYRNPDISDEIIPDWDRYRNPDDVDDDGFDMHNVEENGSYVMDIELAMGTKLCRYGEEGGRFSTYAGSPYEQLGLPWKKETQPYFEYEVIADGYRVKCIVTKGIVGAMFNSPGGAVQFKHPHTLRQEVEKYETLRRIDYEERNGKQVP